MRQGRWLGSDVEDDLAEVIGTDDDEDMSIKVAFLPICMF